MRALTAIAAVCAGGMMCCCTSAHRSYMTDIGSGGWHEPVTFAVVNADTAALCDIFVALRHDGRIAGRPVTVEVRTETPDSLTVTERLTAVPAEDGRSSSSQHEAALPYRRRVRFPRTGEYRITLTPQCEMHGVTAVGIDIAERVNE